MNLVQKIQFKFDKIGKAKPVKPILEKEVEVKEIPHVTHNDNQSKLRLKILISKLSLDTLEDINDDDYLLNIFYDKLISSNDKFTNIKIDLLKNLIQNELLKRNKNIKKEENIVELSELSTEELNKRLIELIKGNVSNIPLEIAYQNELTSRREKQKIKKREI